MFRQFRNVFKEAGVRGWRLEQDDSGVYLSKWHEEFNDDEYKIYIAEEGKQVSLVKAFRVKNNNKIKEIADLDAPYMEKAKELCEAYARKYLAVTA